MNWRWIFLATLLSPKTPLCHIHSATLIRTLAPECPLHPDETSRTKLHLLSWRQKKATPQILGNPRGREKRPQQESKYRHPCQMCHHITRKRSPSPPSRQVSAGRQCGLTPARLKCRSPWAAKPVTAPQGEAAGALRARGRGRSGACGWGKKNQPAGPPLIHTPIRSPISASSQASPACSVSPHSRFLRSSSGRTPRLDPSPRCAPPPRPLPLRCPPTSPKTPPPPARLFPARAHPSVSLPSLPAIPPHTRRSRDPLTGLRRGR